MNGIAARWKSAFTRSSSEPVEEESHYAPDCITGLGMVPEGGIYWKRFPQAVESARCSVLHSLRLINLLLRPF
jgi:hypothetical protein